MTGKPRLAPKPKITASKTAGGQLATPATKTTAQAETPSGGGNSTGGGSKIPRPDRLTKKWESTSKLEAYHFLLHVGMSQKSWPF